MTKKDFRLTKSEMELMEHLWKSGRPMTKAEIVDTAENRSWKASYTFRIINFLLEKGAIKVAGKVLSGRRYARLFTPTLTRDEYYVMMLQGNPIMTPASVTGLVSGALERADAEEKKNLIFELEQLLKEIREEQPGSAREDEAV